ncbi:hypothetical protein [Neisseria shayeganii]|uniref:Uncharacterized protein n=1 Tax=Neisseria shayeganii TaxID=607712 RepID=A0A7D7NAA5_9NEIS|nr:hypothetical protein [Neisseria shayeganii]QMT41117.1 hypothetical protein H3L94_03515 [Neisseria shayeganii]
MTYRLADFLEVMQHEMQGCGITLSAKGYRLDGKKGVKSALGIRDANGGVPKSCDYMQESEAGLLFVEFSDFERQVQQQQKTLASVSKVPLQASEQKRVRRLLAVDRQLQTELYAKVCDTDFILREVVNGKLLPDLPNLSQPRHVLVVWHERGGVDTARLLDSMLLRLKGELSRANLRYLEPRHLYCLSLDQYQQQYGGLHSLQPKGLPTVNPKGILVNW